MKASSPSGWTLPADPSELRRGRRSRRFRRADSPWLALSKIQPVSPLYTSASRRERTRLSLQFGEIGARLVDDDHFAVNDRLPFDSEGADKRHPRTRETTMVVGAATSACLRFRRSCDPRPSELPISHQASFSDPSAWEVRSQESDDRSDAPTVVPARRGPRILLHGDQGSETVRVRYLSADDLLPCS